LSTDPTQKLSKYIATLEDINEEFLKSLKYSVKVLKEINAQVPNPKKWQEMLDTFDKTIKVGERIVREKRPI